jgi:hypothetical protein
MDDKNLPPKDDVSKEKKKEDTSNPNPTEAAQTKSETPQPVSTPEKKGIIYNIIFSLFNFLVVGVKQYSV